MRRPPCRYCDGSLNRVGKTPAGHQKYRCSSCGRYDSDIRPKLVERKREREQQRQQKLAESARAVTELRSAGFLTRGEMAQRLGVSLTWLVRLVRLGQLEEVRQRGRWGRFWVRQPKAEQEQK